MTEAKSMAETHWSRWFPSSISLTFPIENLQAVLNISQTVSHRLREWREHSDLGSLVRLACKPEQPLCLWFLWIHTDFHLPSPHSQIPIPTTSPGLGSPMYICTVYIGTVYIYSISFKK